MKQSGNLNKLMLASAVSMACAGSVSASETLEGIKVSNYNEQLLVNTIITENDGEATETYVETALLNSANLPIECDPISVYPVAELSSDNPDPAITGDWHAISYLILEEFLQDDEEEDSSEEEAEDKELESFDLMPHADEDDDDDDDDDEDEDEDEDDDEEDDEDESEEVYQHYFSISADGFMVLSEYYEVDAIASCEVTYLGELVGDTFTAE